MKLHASGEDYLEAILVLHKKMGMVRSVDVARQWLPCGTAAFSQWTATISCT